MARTTMRSSKGKKLYAKRDKKGQFTDIQSYKRAHGQDIKRKSKAAEEADLSRGTLFHPRRWVLMKASIATNRNLVFLIAGALIAVLASQL